MNLTSLRDWLPSLSQHFLIGSLAVLAYVLTTRLRREQRAPATAIGWVLGLALLPYLVLPMYLVFGQRKLRPAGVARLQRGAGTEPQHWASDLVESMGLAPASRSQAVQFQGDGAAARQALWQLIDGAKQRLDVCTFIIGDDDFGLETVQRLALRARDGLTVRVLLDGTGALMLPRRYFRLLRAAGCEVAVFRPFFSLRRNGPRNLRNHRKLVIADDCWLWSGGRNLAAEYFEGKDGEAPWRDISFVLDGPCAGSAAFQFEQDWASVRQRPARPLRLWKRGSPADADRADSPAGPAVGAVIDGHATSTATEADGARPTPDTPATIVVRHTVTDVLHVEQVALPGSEVADVQSIHHLPEDFLETHAPAIAATAPETWEGVDHRSPPVPSGDGAAGRPCGDLPLADAGADGEAAVDSASPPQPAPAPCPSLTQFLPSGPDQLEDTAHALLLAACFRAERRILAITPYFVPDDSLRDALRLASRRGVDVTLVIPAQSNHRLADFVRSRAMRDLADAGVAFLMLPFMAHAKAVVVDDSLALCGSINLDLRSLLLNHEASVVFYGDEEIAWLAQWITATAATATPYEAKRPGLARDIVEGLVLTLAFQL